MNCPICGGVCYLMGSVPFDRNNNNIQVIDSTPIEYFKCNVCFCIFAPEMLLWTPEKFAEKVYNAEYVKYDPDYTGARSKNYSEWILKYIDPRLTRKIKHLDYGSGEGHLSKNLKNHAWNTNFYDPYSSKERPSGKFNFITAIEVVEHSPNIRATIRDMLEMLDDKGVILFSTQLSDEKTALDWWYIGARNGHVQIQSDKSMKILAKEFGLRFKSVSSNLHLLTKDKPNVKLTIGWNIKW